MVIDFTEFLIALSYALDLSNLNKGIGINHSKRVCYISLKICDFLSFSNKEKSDIATLSLLHHLKGKKNEWIDYLLKDDFKRKNSSDFKNNKVLLKDILKFTCYLDCIFDLSKGSVNLRDKILYSPSRLSFLTFNKDVIEAFHNISKDEDFWYSIKDNAIDSSLKELLPSDPIELSVMETTGLAYMLCDVIDSKSSYTRVHSNALTKKTEFMADFLSIKDVDKTKLVIAANLHDIGKLAVPIRILDKAGFLTSSEYETIKTHPYYTRMILSQIKGFEEITEWASNHHEKLNGNGYPLGLSSKEMDFNSRLIACLDIYQALTEDRPYREQLPHSNAVNIMKNMCNSGDIDEEIVYSIEYAFA